MRSLDSNQVVRLNCFAKIIHVSWIVGLIWFVNGCGLNMSEFADKSNKMFACLFSMQDELDLGQTELLAIMREFVFRLEVSHRVRIISVIHEAEKDLKNADA